MNKSKKKPKPAKHLNPVETAKKFHENFSLLIEKQRRKRKYNDKISRKIVEEDG